MLQSSTKNDKVHLILLVQYTLEDTRTDDAIRYLQYGARHQQIEFGRRHVAHPRLQHRNVLAGGQLRVGAREMPLRQGKVLYV